MDFNVDLIPIMLNNKALQDLTGFYVNWHGISAVLSTYFFLITKCLSVALTDYLHCPSKTDVTQKFIRGTKNFETYCVLPGNRCKFTSMFICTSLAHPCASVACCQTKFQVPLTAFIMHPYFDEPYRHLVKHWKDCFYLKKKNKLLSNCGIL